MPKSRGRVTSAAPVRAHQGIFRGALYLGKFFDKLEKSKIYDTSLIVIVSDHGGGIRNEAFIESHTGSTKPFESSELKRNFGKDKSRALPLVLIKRIDATGPLTVSDSPVSLVDVPGTILSEVNIEPRNGFDGPSMFDLNSDTERDRFYGAFSFNAGKSDYVGSITMYRVNGHSWLDSSWSFERMYPPPSIDVDTQ